MRRQDDTDSGELPDRERRSPHALDLDNYVPAHLTLLANKLSSGASALYRRRFGLGIVDWRIMSFLAIEPWIGTGRIFEVIGLDKAAVSRSVRFMIGKGLVESRYRNGNQRRQYFALTKRGIELHDEIVKVALEREKRLLAVFSEEQTRTLVSLLATMQARLPQVAAGDD